LLLPVLLLALQLKKNVDYFPTINKNTQRKLAVVPFSNVRALEKTRAAISPTLKPAVAIQLLMASGFVALSFSRQASEVTN
jgi:hypothetical protein